MTPFLAFTKGRAAEAIGFYKASFPDARLTTDIRFGPDGDGPEGRVRLAVLDIGAAVLRIIDAPADDGFDLSSGVSVYAQVEQARDVDAIADRLSEGGAVMMPADTYDFAGRFAWVADRFGVNWQLVHDQRLGG